MIKKNDFYGLIDLKSSVDKDYDDIIKETRNENKNLKKEVNDLYEESKRLLNENIKLEAELKKYKPETRDIDL